MVVTFYNVIEKAYSFFRSNLIIEIYFVTIYTRKDNDSIFFDIFLKLREFADPTPSIQIDTGRFEQVLTAERILYPLQ